MLGKALAITTLSSFVLLSALLQVTSPSTAHPLIILVVFALIYLLALGVLTVFILAIGRIYAMMLPDHRKHQARMSLEHAYYYASVLALAPVLYLGVKSVGHAGALEVGLIGLFELTAWFFVAKRM